MGDYSDLVKEFFSKGGTVVKCPQGTALGSVQSTTMADILGSHIATLDVGGRLVSVTTKHGETPITGSRGAHRSQRHKQKFTL